MYVYARVPTLNSTDNYYMYVHINEKQTKHMVYIHITYAWTFVYLLLMRKNDGNSTRHAKFGGGGMMIMINKKNYDNEDGDDGQEKKKQLEWMSRGWVW